MKKIPLPVTLLLVLAFALIIVTFAIQNNEAVTLSFGKWSFESSMAVFSIISFGAGVLITSLIMIPFALQKNIHCIALKTKVKKLEKQNTKLDQQRYSSSQKEESGSGDSSS